MILRDRYQLTRYLLSTRYTNYHISLLNLTDTCSVCIHHNILLWPSSFLGQNVFRTTLLQNRLTVLLAMDLYRRDGLSGPLEYLCYPGLFPHLHSHGNNLGSNGKREMREACTGTWICMCWNKHIYRPGCGGFALTFYLESKSSSSTQDRLIRGVSTRLLVSRQKSPDASFTNTPEAQYPWLL